MILCVRDFNVVDKELFPAKSIIHIPEGRVWYFDGYYLWIESAIDSGREAETMHRFMIDNIKIFKGDFPERYTRKYRAEQSSRFAELLADGIPEYLDFSAIQDELLIKYEFVPADFFDKV